VGAAWRRLIAAGSAGNPVLVDRFTGP